MVIDMTNAELLAAEMDAGFTAAKAAIDANVPRMLRKMISDETIMALVAAIVEAVDMVRDQQPQKAKE